MTEAKKTVDREGGPYMIQDHDHMTGQMGGNTGRTGRQAEQSAGDSAQHGGHQSSGQQGGEKSRRRSKLL